jgi:hypothetical protein
MAGWIKFNDLNAGAYYPFGYGGAGVGTGQGISVKVQNGYISYYVKTNSSSEVASLVTLKSVNTWYYVAVTRENNNFTIYIDGVYRNWTLIGNTGDMISDGGGFKIGTFASAGNGGFFNGSVDEVRVYNRSLSVSEIQALYAERFSKNITSTTDSSGNARLALPEYQAVSTNGTPVYTYFSNYTINATTNYYPETTSVNMSTNRNSVFTLDVANPSATLINPANNSFVNNGTQNFTVNISDVGEGIKNATLNVFDLSGNNWGSFDGANDYVFKDSFPVYPNSTTQNITFSLWVNFNTKTNYKIMGYASGNWEQVYFGSTPTALIVDSYNSSGSRSITTCASSYNAGVWYKIVVYFDFVNNTTSCYVNDIAPVNGTLMWTYHASMQNIGIGCVTPYNTNCFNGSIDEVRIYNRTLSSSEISGIYSSGLKRNSSINNSGLVAWYDFESPSNATRLVDVANGLNNGTITGMTYANSYSSTTTYVAGTLTATLGIVMNLVDGVYKWFYNIFDWAGNNVITSNNTLTIDTTYPTISADAPVNNTYSNSASNNFSATASDSNNGNVSVFIDIDNSLVSWWRMDDTNSTGTLVQDYMGRNNGTAVGGASQVTNGKFGKAWGFDGTGYVRTPYLINKTDITISAWFYIPTNAIAGGILGDWVSGGNYVYAYMYSDKHIRINFGYTTNEIVMVSDSYPAGWNYLTVVLNRTGNMTLYKNGVYSATKDISAYANNSLNSGTGFTIGRIGNHLAGYYFNGSIDDVMIFNRSLSASEVASLYANASTKYLNATITGMADGVHNYKVYTQDLAGNVNSTDLRYQTLDRTSGNASLLSPLNDSYTNVTSQNFTANISDNIGIKNGTFYIYNSSNELVLNQSVTGYGSGKALSFDGSNDVVNVTNTGLGSLTSLTVSSWVNFNTEKLTEQHIVSIGNIQNFYISNTWSVGNGSGYISKDIGNIRGSWHMMTYTFNSTTRSLYLDGSLIKNDSSILATQVSPVVKIGAFFQGGFNLNGSIDEVLIFNRSLNATEISQLYNSGAGLYANISVAPFNSGLVTGYHFDNTSGDNSTYFVDITGVNNGTCIGTACPSYTTGKVKSPTETTFDSGIISTTVGIVVKLVDGIYNWFVKVFDWAGNTYNTENNTLTIDTTYPLIEFDVSNPTNGTGSASAFNITALVNETNIGNVTVYFNSTNYIYPFNTSYFTRVSGNQYLFSAEKGPLGATEQIYYNLTITDKSGQQNSTETRLITGNLPPSLVSLVQSPTTNASLDPNVLVEINATLYDEQNNFESAWLQWKNSSQDWNDIIGTDQMILMSTNGSNDSIFANVSFNLPEYGDTLNYRIFTNDSIGGEANLSVYNISSYYDCTWNMSESSGNNLGQFFGWETKENFVNFTIYNTGDVNYTDMCPLQMTVSHNLIRSGDGSLRIDDIAGTSKTYENVTAGETVNVKLYFDYRTLIYSDSLNLTIEEDSGNAEHAHADYLTATLISTSGPYLYQEQLEPESRVSSNLIVARNSSYYEVYLSNQTIILNSSIRNGVGDGTANKSAYNVTSAALFDSIFSFTNESNADSITSTNTSFSFFYGNISDGLSDDEKHYNALVLNLTNFVDLVNRSNDYLFELNSYGYDASGSQIIHANNVSVLNNSFYLKFLCYSTSDGYCVSQCDKDLLGINVTNFDPDCAYCGNGVADSGETCSSCVADVGPCESSIDGTSAGGGGGGGGGGGSFDKSSATFSLVRGEKQEFELTFENKLNFPKKNIEIEVTGNNSQYVVIEPKSIDYVGAKSSKTITVKVNAPSYFTSGKFLLQFIFKGTIQGNTSSPFTEVKYVTLEILEMTRLTADEIVNNSLEILNKMNESGFYLTDVQKILNSMNTEYGNLKFNNLKDLSKQVNDIYTAATESEKLIEELNQSIIEAEKNGVSVTETKKLLYLAQIIFARGDYVNAYAKLKEAKSSFLLETKGEFSLYYTIKNNPVESLGIFISLSLVGLGSGYLIRLGLLKRKLRILGEEEVLLLQLMKVIQRDCFEGNKMSMEEYNEAMIQYESRLSKIIQEKIKTETQIANINKLSGKKIALKQERDRLVILVKQTQDDYMNKGKLDTRIYENMLRTYATRLNKIQEDLAYMEAEDELRRVTRFWAKWFGKKVIG